ncbi:hypothetical protein F4818DRAFT_426859 [Hypoxylon cercidicola]|nr:hypothetical protein F4818DRAFT_426859 [Hypoxylon cercidicola]
MSGRHGTDPEAYMRVGDGREISRTIFRPEVRRTSSALLYLHVSTPTRLISHISISFSGLIRSIFVISLIHPPTTYSHSAFEASSAPNHHVHPDTMASSNEHTASHIVLTPQGRCEEIYAKSTAELEARCKERGLSTTRMNGQPFTRYELMAEEQMWDFELPTVLKNQIRAYIWNLMKADVGVVMEAAEDAGIASASKPKRKSDLVGVILRALRDRYLKDGSIPDLAMTALISSTGGKRKDRAGTLRTSPTMEPPPAKHIKLDDEPRNEIDEVIIAYAKRVMVHAPGRFSGERKDTELKGAMAGTKSRLLHIVQDLAESEEQMKGQREIMQKAVDGLDESIEKSSRERLRIVQILSEISDAE